MILCEYGCGNEAKFQLNNGKWCCSKHHSSCEANRKKNSEKVKEQHKLGNMKIDHLIHFKKDHDINFKPISEIFSKGIERTNMTLLRYIEYYKLIPIICDCCGITEYNNLPIVLELNHIDGDRSNNLIENLQLLCPNCHSQTHNFRGRNINTGKIKVSDDNLAEALKTSSSIRQALMKVGLTPKGDNYSRAYRIKHENNITMQE